MKIKNYILFILFSIIILDACKKDYISTTPPALNIVVDMTKPISFSGVIVPIFTSNCLGSGCHISGGQAPTLTADKAYDQLTQLGYVDAITPDTIPTDSKLYQIMTATSKQMPPKGKLSSSLTDLIALWIKQGSNNN